MTGDKAREFMLEGDGWRRYNLECKHFAEEAKIGKKAKRDHQLRPTNETNSTYDFWKIMKKYDQIGSVMTCAGANNITGLRSGHAYSLLQCKEVSEGSKSFRLIQIR